MNDDSYMGFGFSIHLKNQRVFKEVVYANTGGDARKILHAKYAGSIVNISMSGDNIPSAKMMRQQESMQADRDLQHRQMKQREEDEKEKNRKWKQEQQRRQEIQKQEQELKKHEQRLLEQEKRIQDIEFKSNNLNYDQPRQDIKKKNNNYDPIVYKPQINEMPQEELDDEIPQEETQTMKVVTWSITILIYIGIAYWIDSYFELNLF